MFQLLKTHLEITSFSLGVVLKGTQSTWWNTTRSQAAVEGFLLGGWTWWSDGSFPNLNNSTSLCSVEAFVQLFSLNKRMECRTVLNWWEDNCLVVHRGFLCLLAGWYAVPSLLQHAQEGMSISAAGWWHLWSWTILVLPLHAVSSVQGVLLKAPCLCCAAQTAAEQWFLIGGCWKHNRHTLREIAYKLPRY